LSQERLEGNAPLLRPLWTKCGKRKVISESPRRGMSSQEQVNYLVLGGRTFSLFSFREWI
jgi:hypothetical protein